MTPEGWQIAHVDDLFEIQLGKMLNKEASSRTPAFPYLGNREVQWGRLDFTDLRQMFFSDDERKKFKLRKGDLLVCEGGEVGRAALWLSDFECYFQKALHRLRPSDSRALPEYMLHFMRFAATSGRLSDFTSQSSIAHLTQEKLAQVEVLVPPLGEQKKIAAILSSVDEAIEATQAVIDQLQVVTKAMMAELLTRGLPGRHTRFHHSGGGEVPESWRLGRVDEFFRLQRGFDITAKHAMPGDVPVISSGGIAYYHAEAKCAGPGVVTGRKGKLGEVFLVKRPYWPHDTTLWVSDFRGNDPSYVAWFLRHLELEKLDSATAVPTLNRNNVHPRPAAFPNLTEQQMISAALDSVVQLTEQAEAEATAKRVLKAALMSVLLTGEVRVKPDEVAL